MIILQTENLTKIYGEGDASVKAVDDVALSIDKGESVAIVGSSGSGKSTLIHLVAGVDYPSSGRVVIDEREITSLNESDLAIFRRRNIGIVYQFYNLISALTVEENVMLPYLLDNRKTDDERLENLLRAVGLLDKRKCLPGQLSGGQQQRVSAIRALINDPAIVLADEPTGNLDSRSSRELMDLLCLANKEYGQTLLTVTHDEGIALQADRIITMEDGRIVGNELVR